ncbi:transposon Tf2-9 polyprotein [Trichonephila clavipes]|nr:transposon Tf2-9 polyprotein [Trichonephila clavipes]
MRIILKDDIPVYQPARRLSFSENQDVNKQIDEWLEQGIVRPSSSEYASPIVLVKKKDGTTRLCVDYRRLNRKLVKDRFPLPLIEDVLDRLQEPKCTQR